MKMFETMSSRSVYMKTPRLVSSAILLALLLSGSALALVDDRNIGIKTPVDVEAKRAAMVKFIWGGAGIPKDKLPIVEKNDQPPITELQSLKRVDTFTIEMELGE